MDSSRCPGWYRQQGLFLHKGEVPTVYADKPEAGLPDSPPSRGDPLPRRRLIELPAKDRLTDATGQPRADYLVLGAFAIHLYQVQHVMVQPCHEGPYAPAPASSAAIVLLQLETNRRP